MNRLSAGLGGGGSNLFGSQTPSTGLNLGTGLGSSTGGALGSGLGAGSAPGGTLGAGLGASSGSGLFGNTSTATGTVSSLL